MSGFSSFTPHSNAFACLVLVQTQLAAYLINLRFAESLMASRNCCGGSWRIGERDRLLQDHQSVPRNTDSAFRITSPSPGTPVRPQDHQSVPRITDSAFRITRPSPGTPIRPQDHQNDS
ncbi:hypothetical protein E8E15_000225 [Penicillium rubens]|nr:hypothetical protein E8E15_000225 [Penicillium rubens]